MWTILEKENLSIGTGDKILLQVCKWEVLAVEYSSWQALQNQNKEDMAVILVGDEWEERVHVMLGFIAWVPREMVVY